jgi:hypothetical protein
VYKRQDLAITLAIDARFKAMIGAGSILRGEHGMRSDFDIIAITKDHHDYSQRFQDTSHGVFYELFVYSERELIRSFKGGDYQDMNMVAYGHLTFGDKTTIEKLIVLAKQMFSQGPDELSHFEKDYKKYLVWDSYCDIEDIICTDQKLAISLMHSGMWRAIDTYYACRGMWPPKRKYLKKSLELIDTELYKIIDVFLRVEKEEHLDSYRRIVEYIIKPRNTIQPYSWKSLRKVNGIVISTDNNSGPEGRL